jgi:5-methylcytosine-specific restriction enzyme A
MHSGDWRASINHRTHNTPPCAVTKPAVPKVQRAFIMALHNATHKHLYNRAAWKRMRLAQLATEPLCRMCTARNLIVMATVVDHIKPHKGCEALFFDTDNLQSLCKLCHDGAKQAQESGGLLRGCGTTGIPLDLNHHWHAGA